jgi:hypothetical protein
MIITCIKVCFPPYSSIEEISSITIGSRYLVTDFDSIGFKIINNNGHNYWYDKDKFEPIEITRNKKLEDLGI